jgi:hypothetical protein
MKFVLKYRGLLVAQEASRSRQVKQTIRCQLHPQLAELWRSDTNRLATIDPKTLQTPVRKGSALDVTRPILGFSGFFYRYPIGGFNFVPLVTVPLEAHCHLDVRLHRSSQPGGILFAGGDLDNRLKVLFDALRMPLDNAEVDKVPREEGEVFYTLLADDALITKLSIESFRLLGARPEDENYVEVEIEVTIQAVTPMGGTVTLLFP